MFNDAKLGKWQLNDSLVLKWIYGAEGCCLGKISQIRGPPHTALLVLMCEVLTHGLLIVLEMLVVVFGHISDQTSL